MPSWNRLQVPAALFQCRNSFSLLTRLAGTAATTKGKPVDGKRDLLGNFDLFVPLIIQRVFVLCSLVWMKGFTLQQVYVLVGSTDSRCLLSLFPC